MNEDTWKSFSCFLSNQSFYTENLYEKCRNVLNDKLQSIAVRTIIEEIHDNGKNEIFEYQESTEKTDNFLEILYDKKYSEILFEKYPVLKECQKDAATDTIENLILFLKRFSQDKERIETELLHRKITCITDIETNLSDAHNKGNSVIKVELDKTDYLIYKPHSLENERIFYEIAKQLGNLIGLDFYSPSMICGDGYGWESFIEQKSCDSEDEVHRYYKRIGVLLFLAYVLKSSDLHMENLIAYGEYPVFVDMEALFTPVSDMKGKDFNECIKAFIQQSVISTGILPFYHWNGQNQGINVSALSHEDVQTLPVRVPTVADKNTANMHITYKYGKVYPSKNQVKLNGKKVVPEKYVKDVLEGFDQIYKRAIQQKKKFLQYFTGLWNLYSRYLVADTQKYSMLISLSYHPDLMKDRKKREAMFQVLWKFKTRKSQYDNIIHTSEMRDLLHGDVPMFRIRYDSRNLYFHDEVIIENYTDKTAYESLIETIENLDEADSMKQHMIIETSMSFLQILSGNKINNFLSDEKVLSAVDDATSKMVLKKGFEKILKYAIPSSDKTALGWLSPQIIGRTASRFGIQNSGMYLYDGLAGMFYLFALAVHKLNCIEYMEICEKLKKQLFAYTESVKEDVRNCQTHNTGIFHGEASIVAVYLLANDLTGDAEYLEMARQHAKMVSDLLEVDENYDLLDGKAGAILVFLELYKRCKDDVYLTWARKAEKLLYASACIEEDEMSWIHKEYGRALLGMAHGNAGIALAYGKLYEITGEFKYADRLEKVILYEHRRYNERTGDWYDYRKPEEIRETHEDAAAWCHGAGGILSSRLELKKINLSEGLQEILDVDIKRAVERVKGHFMQVDVYLYLQLFANGQN